MLYVHNVTKNTVHWDHCIYDGDCFQAMYKNLKDDEEEQRDISQVIKQLTDTVQTADNLLHQVKIDGYQVCTMILIIVYSCGYIRFVFSRDRASMLLLL